jgi:hypothetical protein
MSDKSRRLQELRVRFARSATKHRIPKESIRYVIAHCGLVFDEAPPARDARGLDRRLVCLGDDASDRAQLMAVEGDKDDLIVIHAMALREKYQVRYREAKQWRR